MYYKDGKTYGSVTAIRNELKDVSLPVVITDEMLADIGYLVVVDGVKPDATDVQVVVHGDIEIIDGVPTQQYMVQDMFSDTPEYIDMEGVLHPAKTKAEHEAEHLANKQAEAIDALIAHFTNVTTSYIEGKVQEYNKANGLVFKDIDAFTKYAINTGSQHYAIANRFIAYADAVWVAVRLYQSTATAVPTEEEFKAVLDSVVF